MSEERSPADAVRRRTLSPRVRVIWGIRAVVGVAILSAIATVGVATTRVVPAWVPPVLGLLALLLALLWVQRRYRVWAFEVRPDALYLERGVVTHVRTIAPYVRIQHVDTQRGPLERWLGLSTLVVYTAGSRGADVAIPGLTPDEASDLQDRVKQLAIEAEGGDAV
jgi:membrane protein YdbS with pleckstrin-like domain